MISDNSLLLILIGFILLMRFKSVLLKLILFIYWYPLVTIYLFCLDYPLGGSIDILGRPINEIFAKDALSYAILGYFIFVAVIWNLRTKKFKYKRFKFSESLRVFISILLLITSILAYPKAFGIGDQRWNLIGGPWLVISISLNALLILSFIKFKSISSIIQLTITLILLVGGERVNNLITFFLFFILYSNSSQQKIIEKKLNFSLLFFGSTAVIIAIGAHYWRNGETFKLLQLYSNIISSSTVGDVVHIYLTSFTYLNEKGLDYRPILNEIGSLLYLPNIGGTGKAIIYNFTEILRVYIHNNGGGLFYTEGVLIFGRIGVIIYAFIYGLLVKYLFVSSNKYISIVAIIFFVLQFRIQWYGFMYIYSPIWFSIIMFKLLDLIKKRKNYFIIIEE